MRGVSPTRLATGGSLSERLRPWAPVLLVFAVGVVLSLAAYQALVDRDRSERAADLELRTTALLARTRQILEVATEAVSSLAGLFGASQEVERDEFRSFVSGTLAREPLIHALAWAPRSPTGSFPVHYVEPARAWLGEDLAGLPGQAEVLADACREAEPRASTQVSLSGQDAVLVHVPVWTGGRAPERGRCEQLLGFVVLVLRPADVGAAVARDVPPGDLEWALVDASGQRLSESQAGAAARLEARDDRQARQVVFVDRPWQLLVAAQHPGSAATPPLVLALGVLISALAAALAGGANLLLQLRQRAERAAQLGQYLLEEELGRGGMGVVYRAHHVMMRRPTALKLLRAGVDGPDQLAQFEREVQLTSKLTHPNTIAIYDYGCTDEGVFYYAMELVDGVSFHDLLQHDGPQPPARVVHLLRQVLYALREAHDLGVVHRDLTPTNLMTSIRGGVADFVKVLDFGLVKELGWHGRADAIEDAGRFFGTPGYTAPEVARGGAADARSDLYAVGAVFYALLTGRPAFVGTSPDAVILAQQHEPPPRPRALRPDVPATLDELVVRCLAADPAARPVSAQEIIDRLEVSGVPAWSAHQAERWWRERLAGVRAAAAREQQSRAGQHTRRTLVVATFARGDDSQEKKFG